MPATRLAFWLGCGLLALAWVPGTVFGQTICGVPVEDGHPLSWANLRQRETLRPYVARGDWNRVYVQLLAIVATDETLLGHADVRQRFLAVVEAVRHDPGTAGVAFRINRDTTAFPARYSLFRGRPGTEPIPLGAGSGCDLPEYLNHLRYYAIAFQQVADKINRPARQATAAAVKELEQRYDEFLFEGFAQYPWEALVNQWLFMPDSILDLPRWQLVLFHPTLGLEVDQHEDGGRFKTGLALETVGIVRYVGSHSWVGLSHFYAYSDIPGRGEGVLLKVNNLSLGVSRHRIEQPDGTVRSERFAFVGVELYSLIQQKQADYAAYRSRIEELGQRLQGPQGE